MPIGLFSKPDPAPPPGAPAPRAPTPSPPEAPAKRVVAVELTLDELRALTERKAVERDTEKVILRITVKA